LSKRVEELRFEASNTNEAEHIHREEDLNNELAFFEERIIEMEENEGRHLKTVICQLI